MDRKTKVIIVGDSFTFGHGCSDREFYYDHKLKEFVGGFDPKKDFASQHCWAALLQREYPNLEVINLAKPGHCNAAIFRDSSTYVSNNDIIEGDILLFNGTHPDRMEVATEQHEHPVSWVMGWEHPAPKADNRFDYNIAKKMYIKHLYHEQIGINNSVASVMGTYGYASVNKLKFAWNFPVLTRSLKSGVLNASFLKVIPESLLEHRKPHIAHCDFSGVNDDEFNMTCRCIDGHINDKGHAIYYEQQIKPLIEKFLNT
jgi:hypothetical protein